MINEIFRQLYGLFGYNQEIFIQINNYTNLSILPHVFQIISTLFKIWNFAICYTLACVYFFFKIKNKNLASQDRELYFNNVYNELVRIAIIYVTFGLSYAAMKFSFNMPRPYCSLSPSQFVTILDVTDERCQSSFPSAHTALVILVGYFLWPYTNRVAQAGLVFLAIIVATSRITLAMHYPADIIYSIFIAYLIIWLGNFLYSILKNNLIEHIGSCIYSSLFYK